MKRKLPLAAPLKRGSLSPALPVACPATLDLAIGHLKGGRLEEARRLLVEVLELDPSHASAEGLLIQVLIRQEDFTALRAEMTRYLEMGRSIRRVELELSHLTLLFGDMPLGWVQYESRWEVPGLIKPVRELSQPRWEGEPFPGKTLLLHWEQGLGDTLMFVRYMPQVKALGGRVLLAAQVPLADLVATCQGVDEVIPHGAPLPPFDLQLPLLSLPRVFGTDLKSIPADIPYLGIPDRVPNRQRLAQTLAGSEGKVRIGIAWAGSPTHKNDATRSIPRKVLSLLAGLPGVAWHSLQLGEGVPPLPGVVVLDPMLRNLSDTAYAISGMDLVITVDTAIAHLAGALGVPTLLLLPFLPDWRWLLGREDSPWYPSMRIYRQPQPGDWEAVLRQVVHDLMRPE